MNFPAFPFAVLDTETTGVLPRVHRIIEFASVRVEGGKVTDTYEQLFSTVDEVPPYVQVLTRIRPDALVGKPTFKETHAEILSHLGEGTLIVGQNLGFDLAMLKAEGIDLGDRPWIDTSLLASLVYPEFRSYSLAYVSTALALKHEPKHRALGDVRATLDLLASVWTRLLELPADQRKHAQEIMGKSTPGYRMLFDALPKATATKPPAWMNFARKPARQAAINPLPLPKPEEGTVELREEGLDPDTIAQVIASAVSDTKTIHWIAVRNLDSALKRVSLPEGVRVLYPPTLLLDPEARDRLLAQETFTAEEATLALKLNWYDPTHRSDLPVHGNERDVWNGKLACSATSKAYVDQFESIPSTLLLDHRQLLAFLAEPKHAAHGVLKSGAHVIVDDASMLEDTATKAYGHFCSIDDLRAAAQGDPALTKIVDLAGLWVEKMRHGEDTHLLVAADFDRPETTGMREQLETALTRTDLPERTREQLLELSHLLDKKKLGDFLMWAERKPDGDLILLSQPEHVDELLKEYLYARYSTTLLVPEGVGDYLPEVVAPSTKKTAVKESMPSSCLIPTTLRSDLAIADILNEPPASRTIVLAPSKRVIEQMFVTYTEALEQKGIAIVCQGLSGGQGRMEAEFLATEKAVWLLTPWMYEGIDLPEESVDHLVLDSVPFDSPGNMLFSRRKSHFGRAFDDYALPRVEHRLFRLLRSYCRHRKNEGDLLVIDKRLFEKSYGERLKKYIGRFSMEGEKLATAKKAEEQMKLF
jgi:DNA polymerase III epsilon subunit-like protein